LENRSSRPRTGLGYVASTGAAIYRVTRGGSKPEVVSTKVAGLPDNIRWSADGKSILVANHTEDPEKFIAEQAAALQTGGAIFTTFNVQRMDPNSMKTEIVMPSGLYGAFGGATTAIEVGNRLWLGSFKSDRVAIFDLNPWAMPKT
jgi:DNA-binding beta-propeller fold protein YncE